MLQKVSPTLQHYESMLEKKHETHGLALLPEDSIAGIFEVSRSRDPVATFQQEVQCTAMYLAMNEAATITQQLPKADECIGANHTP